MSALFFASTLFVTPASAVGFDADSVPAVMDFQFNWSSVGVTGTTEFTFDTATPVLGGQCNNIALRTNQDWCFNGTFSTANAGEGTYTARSSRIACTESTFWFIVWVKTETCIVRQDLRATYAITSAVYDGRSNLGSSTRYKFWGTFATEPASYSTNYTYDLATPGSFSGTLSGPATGTFAEVP